MSRFSAARLAAMLRNEFDVPVAIVDGPYGSLKVFVDGDEVADAGRLAFMGALPARDPLRTAIRGRLARS